MQCIQYNTVIKGHKVKVGIANGFCECTLDVEPVKKTQIKHKNKQETEQSRNTCIYVVKYTDL